MNLEYDPSIIEWFSNWSGTFNWDAGNQDKNVKHGINHLEIEQIFDAPIYIAGKIIQTLQESRWLILGEWAEKGWSLIITTRGTQLRIISCRRQRKQEAIFYEESKKNKN